MRRLVLALLFSGIFTFRSEPAQADFYRWMDDQGNLHVTTEPPPKKAAKVKVTASEHDVQRPTPVSKKILHQAGILTGPEAVYKGPAQTTKPASKGLEHLQPKAAPTVEIFTAPWCKWCNKTRDYFQAKGVAFREYNVDTDPAAAARLKTYNPSGGIPVTLINGQPIVGYGPAQFEAALNAH